MNIRQSIFESQYLTTDSIQRQHSTDVSVMSDISSDRDRGRAYFSSSYHFVCFSFSCEVVDRLLNKR